MILKPLDPFAKHAYILNGLVLPSWFRINILSKKKKRHKEQEKELQIPIMECERVDANALGLIFCIPLIYRRELGFDFLLRSLFTLYVFQAVCRGDCEWWSSG